jgi:outer membrane protein OmpA-like peptidoglycan-associated protein
MIRLKIATATVAAAMAAGCALNPPVDQSLANARNAFNAAQADAHVRQFAPNELAQASSTLTRAELLSKQGAPDDVIAHQSYLAEQRARTAREIALARAAQAEVAHASDERNRVLLEARTREAEAARAQAQARAREAEAAREQAVQQARTQADEARRSQAEMAKLEAELRDLRARPTDRGWVLTLGSGPLFDVGKSTLKPGGRHSIEQVAQLMRRHPDRIVQVEGFTDDRGDSAFNQSLSEQRAAAVKQALVEAGVEAPRIVTRGYGESFPVASNSSEAGRQLNRRVQLVVMPQQETASAGGSARTGAVSAPR